MKKVIAVSLAIIVLVWIERELCWKGPAAQAAGGGAEPVGNGDVNGDGAIDLSDAVYTLSFLFMGGSAPVPIESSQPCDSCCPPSAGKGLPSTGLTTCFDDWGDEIAAGSPDFPGQDGRYKAGCPSEGRFADNGDGTVTDNCTGLMWQKNTAPATYTWQEALKYCEDLEFAGHSDWRLPNVRELQSIVDYGRYGPSIDPVFQAALVWYWSSSSVINMPDHAWILDFHGGVVYGNVTKDSPISVRAVRDVQ